MFDLSKVKVCAEVNPAIEGGKFTIVDGKPIFSIPELGVTFTVHKAIESLLINGAKKVLSATTASQKTRLNAAIIETIDVWREDKSYLTTGEKEKALKPAISQTTTSKKSGYLYASRRLILEGWLVDRKGIDFARSFQALSDPEFEAWMKSEDKKIPQWLRGKLEAYDKAEAAKLLDLEAKVQAKVDTLPDDDDLDDEV